MRLLKRVSGRNEGSSIAKSRNRSKDYTKMDLTVDQNSALKELRSRVINKLPPDSRSDFDILKWLIARNFDVNKAEEMLLKNIEWRKEWEIDSIIDWAPPQVLVEYYPVGFAGYDKEGCPVGLIPFGRSDMRGLLHSCQKRDYIRYTFQILEKSLQAAKMKSKNLQDPQKMIICIFDLEHFSLAQLTWKPALDVVLQLVQMYEANYPELLKTAFVVNAPRIFSAAFALIKPFLNDVTMKKVKMFGQTGWKEELLKDIDAEVLPEHWGGSMRDPDGDPMCPSKICLGGEVPKSYYLAKKKISNSSNSVRSDQLKSLILPKSGKEVIELEVEYPGSEIRWEFQSDDFDVGFAIVRELPDGDDEVLLPYQRVNSHLVPEEGVLVCIDPGKYKITFDNEFSYIRSKKLYYNLQLIPPSEHTKF